MDFLRVNPDKETYKIHMINLDLQKDKIVGIKIADKSGSPLDASAAQFSQNNLFFPSLILYSLSLLQANFAKL